MPTFVFLVLVVLGALTTALVASVGASPLIPALVTVALLPTTWVVRPWASA